MDTEVALASHTDKELPFSFTGKTGEYFGIWIVNLLLIIVTLGIYTAWAKVRTKRYFYGHTLLDNTPFDYLANPISILIGWFIGIAIFATYSVTIRFFPIFGAVFALLIFLIIPWFVVRAMAFRHRNTAYRNIRFVFNKNYKEAALVYIGLTLLVPFTLGLIIPYMIFRQRQFLVDNSHYGQTAFNFSSGAGAFYKLAFKTLGIFILMIVAISIVGGVLGTGIKVSPNTDKNAFQLMIMLPMMLIYFFMFAYWQTRLTNLVWNSIRLEQHTFRSELKVTYMLWLYISNTIAMLCSLGLLIPWARVRTTRYRLSKMTLIPGGNLNAFLAAKQQEENAIGEEIGDIMDIDIGF